MLIIFKLSEFTSACPYVESTAWTTTTPYTPPPESLDGISSVCQRRRRWWWWWWVPDMRPRALHLDREEQRLMDTQEYIIILRYSTESVNFGQLPFIILHNRKINTHRQTYIYIYIYLYIS